MDKVAHSSQGYSQPKRLVERYQGLIVALPQRLAPVKAMASQFIIRDPNVGATVPRTSPGKGAQRTTLFLRVAKPWRLQAICGDQCWLGLALSYKECPSCAILGAGCQKSLSWLWVAVGGFSKLPCASFKSRLEHSGVHPAGSNSYSG